MKDVLEIGFGLIGSGFLFVAAWKLHQMSHEFRRAIDGAAAKVVAAIPAPVAPPVIPECRFVDCQCVRHTEPQPLLSVPMAKYGSAEIVKRSGDDWVHVGWRHQPGRIVCYRRLCAAIVQCVSTCDTRSRLAQSFLNLLPRHLLSLPTVLLKCWP